MSGVAGGNRIPSDKIKDIYHEFANTILLGFDSFKVCKLTGGSTLEKQDHGDIDIIACFDYVNKKWAKNEFIEYLKKFPDDVIVPFKSEKYKGKKYYNSGEIVTVLYPFKLSEVEEAYAQIDVIFALSSQELLFKKEFLDMPAEKQGLIIGMIKTVLIENPKLKDSIELMEMVDLESGEELEFTLSSKQLQLRKVMIDKNFKEKGRVVIRSFDKWKYVLYLLKEYDLSKSFSQLLDDCSDNLIHKRSRRRIQGMFNSMVSVKSGEINTEKGRRKETAKRQLNKILFGDTNYGVQTT